MRTYANEKGIKAYNFAVPVTVNCQLGGNFYRARVLVSIELREKIVDFIDLEDYFKKSLNGLDLTTEALAAEVRDTMVREYEPQAVRVEVISDSHFEIHTITEWKREEAV